MMQMSNPIPALARMLRNGMRPDVIMQQFAAQNPQARQAVQMMKGKTPDQLREMAMNMAKEQGVNINDVLRQFGVNVPSDR